MVASYVFAITIASLTASSTEDANVCRARRCSIEGGEKSENADTYKFLYSRKGMNAPTSAELPVPTSVENQICSSNVGMTDTLRSQFLDMHNYRRSLLALGKVKRDDNSYLLPATNMLQLRYDCALEAAALAYASKCPSHGSNVETRRDEGENFYKIPSNGLANFEDGAKAAVLAWWDAYRNYPDIAESTIFRMNYVGSKVTSFTQMAWAKSRKLGCSIVKCLSNYIVICRYSPRYV
ncbi:unnamed protein product [Cylicocyclus nassatus]|uniref:SCP domain-containing protein n=1 Tax=Cylicocyclus nassatus TaxID=53992 RepID=A0AA36M8R3_CYLNA|nr:unnamed protein product [Cylicocyclus nassatus]